MNNLSAHERMYWRHAFRCMTRAERKRVKTLIRRKRALAWAEINGRQPHNPSYWQICTRQISEILLYGSANWSRL